MRHDVTMRPATADDFDFALSLYLESTKPLLVALGRWDKERILSRFEKGFILDQITVLSSDGADIGWMQISEKPEEFHIDQLHLVSAARNRGTGTRLIKELQKRANGAAKPLALNVIRGNRAKALYERLGFEVVSCDEEKIRMLWNDETDWPGR